MYIEYNLKDFSEKATTEARFGLPFLGKDRAQVWPNKF